MYQIHQNDKGYSFITENNVEYLVYFTPLPNDGQYLPIDSLINNYYYFGIERISEKTGGKDRFIRYTVASIIVNFFVNNPNIVLIFHYSNGDERLQGRRRLFAGWFKEFSEHTTYQFYQHDFLDYSTVCALYKRVGATHFDRLRNCIQESISNLEKSTKS